MIKKILKKFGFEKQEAKVIEEKKPRRAPDSDYRQSRHFSTFDNVQNVQEKIDKYWSRNFKQPFAQSKYTMDAMDSADTLKRPMADDLVIPELQALWFASQTFIGYQLCALLSQNWLISKACLIPAKDATRNGYTISVSDGSDVSSEILNEIKRLDGLYKVNKNLIEFVQMGRVFGIRIAMFVVDVDDPDEYYKNPFNPDGIKPYTYKGISQIDPYWITPKLDSNAAADPADINFYEPTWWYINGRLVHRTHLIIFRTEEIADILKPTYFYGGVPVPQKIAERVYCAEKTANEAPMLTLTKRTDVIKTDTAKATADYPSFLARVQQWVHNRDNYGIKVVDIDEDIQQFDTGLADLDSVIMTQFQLVAAACNVPATKLLGTSPKGFNATGEHEEANYHEELQSIQEHDLTALLNRHHLMVLYSEIIPKYNVEPFNIEITWTELDAMTAKEQAEVNRTRAETGRILMETGAINSSEERARIIEDPDSGYNGLSEYDSDEDEEFSEFSIYRDE